MAPETPLPERIRSADRARALGWAALCLAALAVACSDPVSSRAPGPPGVEAQRIVSLNPSLTAILLALGAGDRLVGVDDFSARQVEEVAHLPRVGGLFNPSLEGVVALEPDAVVVVPSVEQRDLRRRLEGMRIRVLTFENIRFDQVIANIAGLGELVGRRSEAAQRIEAIRRTRSAVERVTAERTRVRMVMVIQRDPVFIVGSGSFVAEMLSAVGADNLGAEFADAYPRVALEWLLDAAPEVLLDLTPEIEEPLAYWSRWPALPAVVSGRVLRLDPERVTLPGPQLDDSLQVLAVALHGPEIVGQIEAARRAGDAAGPSAAPAAGGARTRRPGGQGG
jgi:iron complex transport system substrate-binding protein